jgi:G3E family GTPase
MRPIYSCGRAERPIGVCGDEVIAQLAFADRVVLNKYGARGSLKLEARRPLTSWCLGAGRARKQD